MEIAVQGGCMESGVVMRFALNRSAQAFDWVAVLLPDAQNGNPT